jgi:predicted nucleic acid-binding protein
MWNGASTAMSESKTEVVCDAGPVIHLDELESLFLVEDFRILLPETVHEEIKKHRSSALKRLHYDLVASRSRMPVGDALSTLCKIFALDGGEIEALSIVEENPNAIFFTDDAAARLVAEKTAFKVHGTIGILVRGVRRGLLSVDQVLTIMSQIPTKSSLHIRPSLLQEIMLKVRTFRRQ